MAKQRIQLKRFKVTTEVVLKQTWRHWVEAEDADKAIQAALAGNTIDSIQTRVEEVSHKMQGWGELQSNN